MNLITNTIIISTVLHALLINGMERDTDKKLIRAKIDELPAYCVTLAKKAQKSQITYMKFEKENPNNAWLIRFLEIDNIFDGFVCRFLSKQASSLLGTRNWDITNEKSETGDYGGIYFSLDGNEKCSSEQLQETYETIIKTVKGSWTKSSFQQYPFVNIDNPSNYYLFTNQQGNKSQAFLLKSILAKYLTEKDRDCFFCRLEENGNMYQGLCIAKDKFETINAVFGFAITKKDV